MSKMRLLEINMQISVKMWTYNIELIGRCEQFMYLIGASNENLLNESMEKTHLDEIKSDEWVPNVNNIGAQE